MAIPWWYSGDRSVGLEGDGFSHMSGAFAWMAGRLGSAGPLTGEPTGSPSVMVASGSQTSYMLTQGSKSRCSSEHSESYMALCDFTL